MPGNSELGGALGAVGHVLLDGVVRVMDPYRRRAEQFVTNGGAARS